MAEKSPILRFSQKELTKLFESGDAKIVRFGEKFTEEMLKKESAGWSSFFGTPIFIPFPPSELFTVLDNAVEQGITSLEPHYFSHLTFSEKDAYPGWKHRPDKWFWYSIEEDKIDKVKSPLLIGGWVLIDSTQKPNCTYAGMQMYKNDGFKNILKKIKRKQGDWKRAVSDESRFGFSYQTIHNKVIPELNKLLTDGQYGYVRLPKEIEFNVIGNIFHPEWGKTDSHEWLSDVFAYDHHLIGGSNSLSTVSSYNFSDGGNTIGFRPMVIFPLDSARDKPLDNAQDKP